MVTKGQAVDACPFFQKKGLCQMEKAIKLLGTIASNTVTTTTTITP